MKKTAIVLFNLGGPDSKDAIRPFLLNFFNDPNIVRLPKPARMLLAQFIAWRRTKKQAGQSYGELGNKSPLLENSTAQALAIEQALNAHGDETYKVFVCMRYWHPMADQVAQDVKGWAPDKIVLLPLYPQYSTTTTRSSWQAWQAAKEKCGLSAPEKMVCCYPFEKGFVASCAAQLMDVYKKAGLETGLRPRILLSAHGLPESIVKDGDPYQWQCERSAQAIIDALNMDGLDWAICYQSRVGAQKWIGPSTEQELRRAAKDGLPVVILPHAFTQEHVETLVEIEIEYRELAGHLGVPGFYRVPTAGLHPDYIAGMADMVRGAAADIAPDTGTALCPNSFKECAARTSGVCAHQKAEARAA